MIRRQSSRDSPEDMGITVDDFGPVVVVPESNHRVAEILHTFCLKAVTFLPVGKAVGWAVNVDGCQGVIVEEVGPRRATLNQVLGFAREPQALLLQESQPASFQFAVCKAS